MSFQKPKMMTHCLPLPPTQVVWMAQSEGEGGGQKATDLLQDPLAFTQPEQKAEARLLVKDKTRENLQDERK